MSQGKPQIGQCPSTAQRQYVSSSCRRSVWNNNAFPRAKLARHGRYAVLARLACHHEGFVRKPQGLMLLQDFSRGTEVITVTHYIVDAVILDLRHVDSGIPGGQQGGRSDIA